MAVHFRIERRVERRDEVGYRYTAVVVSPEGEYRAVVYGRRLGDVELSTPAGERLRLVRRRRRHRLVGPVGQVWATISDRRVLVAEAGAVRLEIRKVDGVYRLVGDDGTVGRIVPRVRSTPSRDCFEAHGRRLIPLRDWVLEAEPCGIRDEVWAALLVVFDDRHPTIVEDIG